MFEFLNFLVITDPIYSVNTRHLTEGTCQSVIPLCSQNSDQVIDSVVGRRKSTEEIQLVTLWNEEEDEIDSAETFP